MSRKATSLALAAAFALVGVAVPVVAQDPSEPVATPSPICAVLTSAEIEAAFGVALPVTYSDNSSCSWDDYATSGSLSINVSFSEGQLADYATSFPDATPDEIAGAPVLISPDGEFLFAEANGGVLSVSAYAYGVDEVDVPAAVRSVTEIALGRLPSIDLPVPPTPEPEPSFLGDAELLAMFPKTVAGMPVEVQTATGAELVAAMDPDDASGQAQVKALTEALAAHGKTIDDLSIGFSFFFNAYASGGITALRIRGTDVASLVDELLPILLTDMADLQRTPVQIAGREALLLTDGPAGPDVRDQYGYAKGEVLWVLEAEEPALSELFNQLP